MRAVAFLLIIVSIFIFLASIYFSFFENNEIHEDSLFASVNVTSKAGFDLNNSALIFGNIQKPGSSTRRILLENKYDFPIVTLISAEGDIADLLDYEKIVRLNKGEKKFLSFSAIATQDIDEGLYLGNISLISFKDS